MKSPSFKSLILFISLGIVSCENEAKEMINLYKNQNHSEELKGWWRNIDEVDYPFPNYDHFSDYIVTTHSYNIHNEKYVHGLGMYWYNDESRIYYLAPGSFKSKSGERSYEFLLNPTKDTLKIYMENPPYVFVKDVGL